MLCVEDYIDALTWAKTLAVCRADRPRRCQCRQCCTAGSADNDWIENLAKVEETRSNTSVCLKIVARTSRG
jgi:phosphoserine aminotransferase